MPLNGARPCRPCHSCRSGLLSCAGAGHAGGCFGCRMETWAEAPGKRKGRSLDRKTSWFCRLPRTRGKTDTWHMGMGKSSGFYRLWIEGQLSTYSLVTCERKEHFSLGLHQRHRKSLRPLLVEAVPRWAPGEERGKLSSGFHQDATRSKKGIATRNKDATRGSWPNRLNSRTSPSDRRFR